MIGWSKMNANLHEVDSNGMLLDVSVSTKKKIQQNIYFYETSNIHKHTGSGRITYVLGGLHGESTLFLILASTRVHSQIIFFSSTKNRKKNSATLGIRIFFSEKNHKTPSPPFKLKWSFPYNVSLRSEFRVVIPVTISE